MRKYNVWLQIEEAQEEPEEHYEDIGLPKKVAVFDTLKEAEQYLEDHEATQ